MNLKGDTFLCDVGVHLREQSFEYSQESHGVVFTVQIPNDPNDRNEDNHCGYDFGLSQSILLHLYKLLSILSRALRSV